MLERLRRRWVTLRDFYAKAREVYRSTGRSPQSQLIEWLRLRHAIGLSDREYFLYELHRSDVPFDQKREYFTKVLHSNHLISLDRPEYLALLDDKFIFKQYYASLNFPMPRAYGIFHPFHGRTMAGGPLRSASQLRTLLGELSGPGLVIKDAMSGSGRSVLVFESVTEGAEPGLTHVNGDRFTFDQILQRLVPADPHAHPGFLLEERVKQHAFLERFNPKTLHTTRVVTVIANDGSVNIVGASLKIGLGDSGVESLVEDNLCAPVDLESGRLGSVAQREGLRFQRLSQHPGTKIPIEGETLAEWPKIKQLAIDAALAARCVRSVGWDIGLSTTGPVLIEGNQAWGEEILQIALGKGIWTPRFRAWIGAPAGV